MELCTVAFADIASLTCRNCARTTEFEQPPCPDGHGSDCPEWYCTECGAATFVGWSAGREFSCGRHVRSRRGSTGRRDVA